LRYCPQDITSSDYNIIDRFDDIVKTPSRSVENHLHLFENLAGLGNDIPIAHSIAALVCGGQPGNEQPIPFSYGGEKV
jgi:hypothetical protein